MKEKKEKEKELQELKEYQKEHILELETRLHNIGEDINKLGGDIDQRNEEVFKRQCKLEGIDLGDDDQLFGMEQYNKDKLEEKKQDDNNKDKLEGIGQGDNNKDKLEEIKQDDDNKYKLEEKGQDDDKDKSGEL